MRKSINLLGILAGLGFGALSFLAIYSLGVLAYRDSAMPVLALVSVSDADPETETTAAALAAEEEPEIAKANAIDPVEGNDDGTSAAETVILAKAETDPEPVAETDPEAEAEPDTETDEVDGPYADLDDDAVIEIEPVPYPEDVTYHDAPEPTADEIAEIAAKVAAIEAKLPALDYEAARHDPIHYPPLIETASSAECLACHKEIVTHEPRKTSLAGVEAQQSLAWYQTLDTYSGPQADFHWRHLESDYAKEVMKLECNFCHKGNDLREESPDMMPMRAAFSAPVTPEFTLRKMVNPSETCLMCHGSYPAEIMDMEGDWHELKVDLEYAEAPNGCLSCHAETYRTERHNVNYLNAAAIEEIARNGTSDSCYGCHGGRAWYRTSYPYARHPWPDMDDSEVPEWAVDRPTESKPEHQLSSAP